MDFKKSFSTSEIFQSLRNIRSNKGIPLKTLAGRTGLSVPHLSRILSGKVEPSFLTLTKIAAGLEIQILLNGDRCGSVTIIWGGNYEKGA